MVYLEACIKVRREYSDLVSDLLFDLDSEGVSILDSNDLLELIKNEQIFWDYIDDSLQKSDQNVLITGYFDPNFDIFALKKQLNELCEGNFELSCKIVENDDWIEAWKKFFMPKKIGRLVVVPKWMQDESYEGIPIYLDIGMAFGTGEHETTRMCLSLLQEEEIEGKRVADVGCGSGILGIAALKLGASEAVLTDIDEQAVKASKENAKLNNVSPIITKQNLLDSHTERFDIILGNLTADILCMLLPSLKNLAHKDTKIILSGIINAKTDQVLGVCKREGWSLQKSMTEGEWTALKLVRNE